MPGWLTNAAQLVGLGSAAAGVWLLSPPAALIVAGVGSVLWAEGARRR